MTYILESLRETARRAYLGTSFSPEKRADSIVREHSEELEADLQLVPEEHRESYKAGYIAKLTAWLNAKSRCMSSMITGPANFPVARNEKANRAEQARGEEFMDWRKRTLARHKKAAMPQVDPLEEARRSLKRHQEAHEIMKTANAIVRKGGKEAELIAAGIKPELAAEIMKPNRFGGNTFTFELKNNLANIKRLQARVTELEAKEARKYSATPELQLDGCKIVLNYQIDRAQIIHDEKPAPSVIQAMKSAAFRWSPREGAWQRQLTVAGLIAAARATGADMDAVLKLQNKA